MISKNLKICIAALISIVLLVPFSVKQIQGCGGGDLEDFSEESLFAPEICGDDTLSAYFFSYGNTYGGYSDGTEGHLQMQAVNQKEWSDFIPNPITTGDLEILLYKLNSTEIVRLIELRKSGIFKDSIIPYLLIKTKKEEKYESALTYLVDAKKAESFANRSYYSWEEPSKEQIDLTVLSQDFYNKYQASTFEFIKYRYAFQWIRTLYFAGKYNEGLNAFNKVFGSKSSAIGSIYNRSLGYKAACLYKLGDYSASNIIYAQLFDESREQRFDAFFSFHPQEEMDWQKTLLLAKSNREKEVLWQLFGIYADPLRGMQEIVKLNPSSPRNMVLLMRAAHIVESNKLDNKRYEGYYNEYDLETLKSSLFSNRSWASLPDSSNNEFITFIDSALNKKDLFRPEVWRTTQAYICYLNGKNEKASEVLNYFRKVKTIDEAIRAQNKITDALLYIDKLKSLSPKNEMVILSMIEGFKPLAVKFMRSDNAIRYVRKKLSLVYNSMQDNIHAEIAFENSNEFYKDQQSVELMIKFLEMKVHSPMEKFLLAYYPYKLNDFYELEATNELYKHNLDAALASLNRDSMAGDNELYADPFKIRITDCHDCDFSMENKKVYTKKSFIERMISLKSKAESSKNNIEKSESYFEFANGLYNMTYYGNARTLYSTIFNDDINLATREYQGIPDQDTIDLAPFLDCREAAKYYTLAGNYSKDKEFKAKCIWMQAKCEHNLWLETASDEGNFQAGTNFKLLKEKYSKTKYYKEIINECGYFCTFTGGVNCIRNKDE